MKIAAGLIALATVASTSAASISSNTARKLVRSGRRVEEEEAEEEEEEEEEFAFLGNYSVKMIGCQRDLASPIVNEEGEYEYSAVLLRLCPSTGGCDSSSDMGCSSGYGDILVGVSTFVEAYMQDLKEQQDEDEEEEDEDAWDMDKFAKCEEYNPDDNADDAAQGAWENYAFYVGPTCSDDGMNIKLELFTDMYCSQTSEVEFSTISNGWTLPYSEGGLVSTSCSSCTDYNDDGEAEIKEVCQKTYEESALKCEEGMEYYSYYGQNVAGCEVIAEMFPKGTSGGKIFGWFVLAACVVGLGGYVMWWRKKKAITIE
mmetsp:Transcript_1349/g.3118  ORF Transcript_1349/g.3118 Transcript_1349/m.3118 type:complete len:315 (-) Transcript_1349:158-1102(-)|eukprot:CAMPEP_0116102932 /NCGR_PEP_ID=MMETSP0327-20121206/13616_1 /TAXON_ID=44447 /ORGANISM="Pseudo-nitzschia delicatissima, Strain B596" /LENGTH=314 /DNA_ID=CAMNT_0003595011 /DNA_START=26 /DNA_END=970 /DNA_ORIENTATION=+